MLAKFALAALVAAALFGCSGASAGSNDDNGGHACAVGTDACIDGCIRPSCGASISACDDNMTCAAALDQMVDCVCDAQHASDLGAVRACLTTFRSNGGALASTFADCATTMCETACGL